MAKSENNCHTNPCFDGLENVKGAVASVDTVAASNLKYCAPSTNVNKNNNMELSSSAISIEFQDIHSSSQRKLDIECDSYKVQIDNNNNFWGRCLTLTRTIIRLVSKFIFIFGGVWILLYIWWGDMALLGGSLFALIVLIVTSILCGHVTQAIGLPNLSGMIIGGLILRNVPYINIGADLTLTLSGPLRVMSVVVLLTRGAFSVNLKDIQTFSPVVPALTLGSCFIEATCGGIAAYIIGGYTPAWSAAIGCMASAMSGSAVTPYLLRIEKMLLNTNNTSEKFRETLKIAKTACGLDAIVAICLTECAFGFIWSDGDLWPGLLKGICEVLMGGAWGVIWGTLSGNFVTGAEGQIFAVSCGGIMALLGLFKIGYPRGGPLGVYSGSLIAITIWRRKKAPGLPQLTDAFDKFWYVFQPLLFGIMGARTDLQTIDWTVIYKGAICLKLSIMGRILGSLLMTNAMRGLSWKERLFLTVTWCGKGTVQAALGPVALDTALDIGRPIEDQIIANNVMNLATMTILICSSIPFLLLKYSAPKLLMTTFSSKA